QSDWKPVPRRTVEILWEPVYHAVLANGFVYDPGLGGTIFKLDKGSGAVVSRINPFDTIDPNVFVAGPLSTDGLVNIYYNVWKMDRAVAPSPSRALLLDSWLVKVGSDDTVSKVRYVDLMAPANPPAATDLCFISFERQFVPAPASGGPGVIVNG